MNITRAPYVARHLLGFGSRRAPALIVMFALLGVAGCGNDPSADPAAAGGDDAIEELAPSDSRLTPPAPASVEVQRAGLEVMSATESGSLKDVPIAPTGRPVYESAVANAPGYFPPDDPELSSVWKGRREVGPIQAELTGGLPSVDALAARIVQAANEKDVETLNHLRISRKEFETILWPEFPQSRPATNITADEAWGFLLRSSVSGAKRGVHDWMERDLTYTHVTYTRGISPFTNFTLHRGMEIHATRPDGGEEVMDFAYTFVERNGQFKVYIYKD